MARRSHSEPLGVGAEITFHAGSACVRAGRKVNTVVRTKVLSIDAWDRTRETVRIMASSNIAGPENFGFDDSRRHLSDPRRSGVALSTRPHERGMRLRPSRD